MELINWVELFPPTWPSPPRVNVATAIMMLNDKWNKLTSSFHLFCCIVLPTLHTNIFMWKARAYRYSTRTWKYEIPSNYSRSIDNKSLPRVKVCSVSQSTISYLLYCLFDRSTQCFTVYYFSFKFVVILLVWSLPWCQRIGIDHFVRDPTYPEQQRSFPGKHKYQWIRLWHNNTCFSFGVVRCYLFWFMAGTHFNLHSKYPPISKNRCSQNNSPYYKACKTCRYFSLSTCS